MWIGEGVDAAVLRTLVFAGPLSEADEETLVRSEAVDWLEMLVLRGVLPGDVGDERAAEVGYVFAAGELAVDVDIVDDDVVGKLLTLAVDAVFEVLRVFLGPPVLEVAFGVELAALIVEGVGKLVADGSAGVAVVGGVVGTGIVKGRLQYSSGKVDVVHLRVEVGIDGGRRHAPFVAVDGLADLRPSARDLEAAGTGG